MTPDDAQGHAHGATHAHAATRDPLVRHEHADEEVDRDLEPRLTPDTPRLVSEGDRQRYERNLAEILRRWAWT